ncbi:MAG TPA: hypothetical protein DCE41_00700 [Cytophagales bacterium]|nr:hypothetical protein [Cytophagales bacterium]
MSQELAETALVDQHIYKGFRVHEGPQNVYECGICGYWHLTSKAPTRNERLQQMHDSGEMKRKQEASRWEHGL